MTEPPPRLRLFIAVGVPDDIRAALVDHLQRTVGDALPGRVVDPSNWHLTLRFLGWADGVQRDRVTASLDTTDWGAAFRIRFGDLGAFPKPSRATVLWLGVRGGEQRLAELAAHAEESAVASGYRPEERPYHPHLTLSRVRPPVDVRSLLETAPPFTAGFRVSEVVLYRSHLRRGGARYEPLERFPLGS